MIKHPKRDYYVEKPIIIAYIYMKSNLVVWLSITSLLSDLDTPYCSHI